MDRTVFRLRQLPLDFDRLDALRVLSTALVLETSAIQIFSLARSVDPWLPSKVATLMFDDTAGVKGVLENGDNPNVTKRGDEWCITADNLRDDLVLDAHFRGLTPLYDPDVHDADCIAISGLASHPFGSWQPKGRSKSFMWIRDALPQSLRNVRPILYGYDTTLVESLSFQTIFDLALGLINQLKANGWTLPTCKPLVFLAHSLGGIVLKQAFVSLANKIDRDDPIRQAIRGAVFFGVPNLGMEQSHLMAVVEGQANVQLVEDLSVQSEYLRQLDKQFSGISYLQDALLYWCYETKKSPTVALDSNGKWSRTGPSEILVTPDSATRGLYGATTRSDAVYPINEDHSNMVKFSQNDPNYSVVVQKLVQVLFSRDSSPSDMSDTETLVLESSIIQKVTRPELRSGRKPSHEAILSSLYVPEGDRRFEEIEEKFEDTFDWIYDQPDPGFSEWLQSGDGLFWINGKPGSGKSTLMKFICGDQRTADLLSDWRGESSYIIVSFFFHYRGTSVQKSFEGLLRNVLSQIISKNPRLVKFLQSLFDPQESLHPRMWTLPVLQKGFNNIIRQDEIPLHLCLFLDALDEYDGRLEFICRFLLELVEIPPTHTKQIKICFSSRPWQIFMNAFKDCAGFQIQDFTQEDIRDYCLGSIREESLSSVILEDLVPDIVARSRGVFLWVKFVVKDLAHATRSSTLDKDDLEKLLESFPVELNAYYAEIIERIPRAYRWKAYAMLEVAVRSKDSLEPVTFLCAVFCSDCKTIREGRDVLTRVREINNSTVVESLAMEESRKYCGGLIEVVKGINGNYVQVLHQTVEDFVTDPKFKQRVLGNLARITIENGNNFLAKCYFLMYETKDDPFLNHIHLMTIPSTRMQVKQALINGTYARAAEHVSGRSMKVFLGSVSQTVYKKIYAESDLKIETTLEYAASTGLRLYLVESLHDDPNVLRNSKHQLLSCIIRSAADPKDEEVKQTVKLLLENGFTPHKDPMAFGLCAMKMLRGDGQYRPVDDDLNPLLRSRHIDLIELLLDHGQEPYISIPTVYRRQNVKSTLLHVGPFRAVKLLLDKGASANLLDSMGMTPLDHFCARNALRAPNWFQAYEHYRRQHWELYKLTCLLTSRGGTIKNTRVEFWEELLDGFSESGFPTEDLRRSMDTAIRQLSASSRRSFQRSPNQDNESDRNAQGRLSLQPPSQRHFHGSSIHGSSIDETLAEHSGQNLSVPVLGAQGMQTPVSEEQPGHHSEPAFRQSLMSPDIPDIPPKRSLRLKIKKFIHRLIR
ncbi:uncharacterized protein F4812DRAFT_452075 [Daldinia caldariorum]|uniref:uncharacterized protein n=1 Tax=Daldinia caldariorum TaxID=326644 RepID=UPI0020089AA5|nr:uncharacterized protein F4812DRAFT_452075 [Daldinia caldariorum]KAI1466204.1 hypothetical protein F4812DRAFT_452075 [Daldinia caldariorum]